MINVDFDKERSAVKLTVTGMVQGVGYRPFVRREALSRALRGYVQNSGGGVSICACGEREALDSFVRCLHSSPPRGTVYTSFEVNDAEWQSFDSFFIEKSDRQRLKPMVSPDLAPCADCERALFDRSDRRYRHPFISCASCGPRYSLQTALPYDRERTSMADFALCRKCAEEYHSTDGIRSFAQTIACPECGPRLTYHLENRTLDRFDALDACIEHLKAGGIDAVKNIGGFHLACRADDEQAVRALRELKGREEKPFALLFADLDAIRTVAELGAREAELLTSSARPIVLLRKKDDDSIAPSVCGDSLYIGAMLPSSPIGHLLVREVGTLVMTSANRSGEPLASGIDRLNWLPASVGRLDNDRPIISPQDDSICFVADCGEEEEKALLLRRARGYAPLPIELPTPLEAPTLAMGGDLKSVFALAEGALAYPSPYIGDLEDLATEGRMEQTIDRMKRLLGIEPTVALCDLHPNYHSAKLAEKQFQTNEKKGGFPRKLIKVQHHHAHIASVMAEHSLKRTLGFAFDGTGYGEDGTILGGELLYCEGARYERLMHLRPLPLLGGDSGATDCRRTATAFLLASGSAPWDDRSRLLSAALTAGVGAVETSSMGRLFDAVSSILGICHANAYEGQAATMLENCAVRRLESGGDAAMLKLDAEEGIWRSDLLLLDLTNKKGSGVEIGALALGFHYAIADAIAEAAKGYSRIYACTDISLSGGVFANRLLLSACTRRLKALGLSVYLNEKLPAGDGNIALGQLFVAAGRQTKE